MPIHILHTPCCLHIKIKIMKKLHHYLQTLYHKSLHPIHRPTCGTATCIHTKHIHTQLLTRRSLCWFPKWQLSAIALPTLLSLDCSTRNSTCSRRLEFLESSSSSSSSSSVAQLSGTWVFTPWILWLCRRTVLKLCRRADTTNQNHRQRSDTPEVTSDDLSTSLSPASSFLDEPPFCVV